MMMSGSRLANVPKALTQRIYPLIGTFNIYIDGQPKRNKNEVREIFTEQHRLGPTPVNGRDPLKGV